MLSIANRNTIDSKRGGLTGLNKIFASYNFTNMWSSENKTILGTTTTLHDYAEEHDLVGSLTNQATYNSASSFFKDKPSFTFNGTTHKFSKSVTDWRGSDESGVIIGVFKINGGTNVCFLTSGDTATIEYCPFQQLSADEAQFSVRFGSPTNTLKGTSNINNLGGHVVINASTSSSYKIIVDGVSETVTASGGSDDGKFLADVPNRDNICIGALETTSDFSGNIEWVMSGYLPYIDEATCIALEDELMSYYSEDNVYLMAGQSNAGGWEDMTELQAEYIGANSNVKIWDGSNYSVMNSTSNNNQFPIAEQNTHFGTEFSFANKMADYLGSKVTLVKHAKNSTGLGVDGSEEDWNTTTNELYTDFKTTITDSLTIRKPQAFIWIQGEKDAKNLTKANNYEANLTNLINGIRTHLNNPTLKVCVVLLNSNIPVGVHVYKATVRAAQVSVAATLSNVVTVDPDAYELQPDLVHYTAQGYEDLGEAIFNILK